MQKLGMIFIIIGIILGLYIGGWLMFIQPILACATAFDMGVLTGSMIAITALKCIFVSFVGYIVFWVFSFIGILLIND